FGGRGVVHGRHDQYATQSPRCWHASGLDLSHSAPGVSVQAQSLWSVLIGGIDFGTPATGPVLAAADADTVFPLFVNRAEAYKPAARDPHSYVLVFRQSIRGLSQGAPVEFRGVPIGEVVEISPQFDAKTDDFTVAVTIRVDP